MALSPGDKLGPYEILAPLGAGGMGEVYKARDPRLDRTVAIKTSKIQFSERFEREARAVAALNHPNICTLHDVGPDYLVMELIDGQPLKGPLPVNKVLSYAAQICDALSAAHGKGITHRDLKPANILVTKQGIKLLDFGLAKRTAPKPVNDDTVTRALTGDGIVMGTPQYMAPEQIEGREADARSDIFALGCVLYEMVTGRRAFEGKTASSIAAAILARQPEPIASLQPLTPAALERVIQSCLAKDPEDRWQSAHDVRLALANLSGNLDRSAGVKPSRKWQFAAIASGLLALAATAASFLRPEKQAELLRFQISENVVDTSYSGAPAISPDGRMLAFFSNRRDQRRQVYIRRLDALKSVPVPGTEGASSYFWSPDGKSLGFALTATLSRVDLASGSVTRLAENTDRAAIWTAKDIVVFEPLSLGPLLQVQAKGGEITPATRLNPELGEVWHRSPGSCGPDGRFIYRVGLKNGTQLLRIGSLAGRPPVTIQGAASSAICVSVPETWGDRHYLLSYSGGEIQARRLDLDTGTLGGAVVSIGTDSELANDNFIAVPAFSVSNTGVIAYRPTQGPEHALGWFDRQGKPLPGVPPGTTGYTPAISLDGSRLVAVRGAAVWVTDLARGTSMGLSPREQTGMLPAWSPDGRHVAYTSGDRIVEIDSTGAGEPRTIATVPNWVQEYAPGGKSILFVNTARMALQTVAVQGGQSPVDVAPPGPSYFPANFSPDGRFLTYTSSESGRSEVYLRAAPPATGKWLVSNNGGGMGAWRADGRELFYLSADLNMMAVDVHLSATPQLSTPRVLFKAKVSGNNNNRNHYVVSRDGQRFLLSTRAETVPISVVMNWPVLLDRPSAQ